MTGLGDSEAISGTAARNSDNAECVAVRAHKGPTVAVTHTGAVPLDARRTPAR